MKVMRRYTLRTLGKNKMRTLVTVVGIILSVAMFTAVTTFISSLRISMVDYVKETVGGWHAAYSAASKESLDIAEKDERVQSCASAALTGYAKIEGGHMYTKDYMCVYGASEEFFADMPLRLIEGRMPQSASELVIPEHMNEEGGLNVKVGDVLALELYSRVVEGKTAGQLKTACEDDVLTDAGAKLYTVVGVIARPRFEVYYAPGYTCLTLPDGSETAFDLFITFKNPRDVFSFKLPDYNGYDDNGNLLRFEYVSKDDAFNGVIKGLGSVLALIIMAGSVCLIYNAFSISVTERTKQFGVMASVGATRRQLMNGVMFEALCVSVVGIPLGVLAGVFGIGATLYLLGGVFAAMQGNAAVSLALTLHVSWLAVGIAAGIGLVTVLISAWIPARRAARMRPIDAIRSSKDVKAASKRVRGSLLANCFGFEGKLAGKYFSRSRRRYRATVLSLTMSIVLFISAGSFCAYLGKGMRGVVSDVNYDVGVSYVGNEAKEVLSALRAVDGVTRAGYAYTDIREFELYADESLLTNDLLANAPNAIERNGEGKVKITCSVMYLDEATYAEYLRATGVSAPEAPAAILYDTCSMYNAEDGRFYSYNTFKSGKLSLSGDYYGNELPVFYASGTKGSVTYDLGSPAVALALLPESAMSVYAKGLPLPCAMTFDCKDHKAAASAMRDTLNQMNASEFAVVHDMAAYVEQSRATITVINVFSYGFITLISLIAAANVFNTISTNLLLRRREIATLRSVGLTGRGLRKMMNVECLLYGLKSLLIGLPLAVGITYLIYRSITNGVDMAFFLPADCMIIAVFSVFAVVLCTMLYAMHKLKAGDLASALTDENL